ncbi:hypothetical protein B0H14DRAFT_3873661 [Mycena olivaceomarginata]|nr:hypothetical protein B0H14DRAFT_3873661 [Mycena olivaceomarginata]
MQLYLQHNLQLPSFDFSLLIIEVFALIMFPSVSFVSIALMMLSSVTALPQAEEGGLMGRATSCDPGKYLKNGGCSYCPAGSFCKGGVNAPEQCDTGTYQPFPGFSFCFRTDRGHFASQRGSTGQTACSPGTYQPNEQQRDCLGVPNGRFQSKFGQAAACATCCGWATKSEGTKQNVNPYKCTNPKPFAWPNSGAGCIDTPTNCGAIPATCAQLADGTCPGAAIS